MLVRIAILSFFLILGIQAQENAGSSVAKSLLQCYNKTENLDRERRPPSTINVLIDLIRKIESGPSIQNDREFSKEIIHRFKQDGIVRSLRSSGTTSFSVPFTPKGLQADKNRILLKQLVPGNGVNFPDETLSELQKCSLHFMISNAVDVRLRGDESSVCNKVGHYQVRVRRDTNPNDDVEVFHPSKSASSKGNLQENEFDETAEGNDEQVPEANDYNVDTDVQTRQGDPRKSISVTLSECPVENGAVYTRWGTIQAGTVIAAIAAGREPQFLKTDEDYTIDNRYAVTLAGDLSEVALHQGASGKKTLSVGAKGSWNETQVPRWFFIEKNINFEMTDAEIRAGLDGLIIAKNIQNWKNKAQSLKLSQILDMYYSPRGVFSKKFRACNRRQLFTEVAPQKEMTEQTIAFSFLLDDVTELPGTVLSGGIKQWGEEAVNALNNYIANVHDLSCDVEDDTIQRVGTDILIVLDTNWSYNVIHRALAYLLDNLDVNKYGSTYTMINAKTGSIMVNATNSILDFYDQYNKTVHVQSATGFAALQALNAVEVMTKRKMDEESRNKTGGGQSTTVLFVVYDTLSDSDKATVNQKKQDFRTSMPDLKLLVLGRNTKEPYADLVVDPSSDIFVLPEHTSEGSAITSSINDLTTRVKQIHRRIINSNCGSRWSGGSSSNSFDQYLEPNSVNYYRVAPNYFFGEGTRSIKIKGHGYGNLVACYSRQQERPRRNSTSGDATCEDFNSNEISLPLNDACKNYDNVQQCPPMYISVEAKQLGEESTTFRCSDVGCRFPDNLKYSITAQGLGCSNGALTIIGNIAMLMTAFVTINFLF